MSEATKVMTVCDDFFLSKVGFSSLYKNLTSGLDDSPYYMPSQHRKKHQQGARHPRPPKSHHGGFPDRNTQPGYRGGQTRVFDSTEESNSDSFRSVIDDLTIKNQKLKKRLRKLEGLHAQHVTHSERLFELRVHDLPEYANRELGVLVC